MRDISGSTIVRMRGIVKRFLDNVANDHVDFELAEGEICALVGENGAGKTTLMNILFGFYGADEGEIEIAGKRVNFGAPKDAIDCGIGMIHQHFTLVSTHTVLENIIIGTGTRLFLDIAGCRSRIEELQARFGLHVDIDAPIWTLSIGEQQKVEILKALWRDSKILIMDEPTAVLAPVEIVDLFETLRTLAVEGHSVVFISHKLQEIMEIADRVIVLRNGRVMHRCAIADTDQRELARMMVGHELVESVSRSERKSKRALLEIRSLGVRNDKRLEAVREFSLTVRQNEIVGIVGVLGNGQTELCDALFGVRMPFSGDILVAGEPLRPGDPTAALRAGMARVPEDRIETGLLMDLSIESNLILENHGRKPISRHGLLDFPEMARNAERLIADYNIKTEGRSAPAKSLSGGNLQKIILARVLSTKPRIVVASQPTRGLDIGAMTFIHQRLIEERDRGAAIIVVSDDIDEALQLSDHVVVMYEGRIVGEQFSAEIDREQIGLWMSGVV